MEVFFDDIQQKIISTISRAKVSLHIAVAWFTDKDIFDKLCELAENGVEVELIIVDDEINQNAGLNYHKFLSNRGVLVLINQLNANRLMHNKFCIIDRQTVINGSYNWTYKAHHNHENITITNDLTNRFIEEFYRLKQIYSTNNQSELIKNFIYQSDNERVELFKAKDELEESHIIKKTEIFDYNKSQNKELLESIYFTISTIDRKLEYLYKKKDRNREKYYWASALQVFETVIKHCPDGANIEEQMDYLVSGHDSLFGYKLYESAFLKPNEDATKFIYNQYS